RRIFLGEMPCAAAALGMTDDVDAPLVDVEFRTDHCEHVHDVLLAELRDADRIRLGRAADDGRLPAPGGTGPRRSAARRGTGRRCTAARRGAARASGPRRPAVARTRHDAETRAIVVAERAD